MGSRLWLREGCYERGLTYGKLMSAYERARVNKGFRGEIVRWERDLESNLIGLMGELASGRYRQGEYRRFRVYDPKEREIWCLPFRDRIVHQWYVEEYIIPCYVPIFIDDSYACLRERGTHKASARLTQYLRRGRALWGEDFYVAKMDIAKFFYSIDRGVLKEVLWRRMKDQRLRALTGRILDDGNGRVGLPIGNYSSQYFANIYLNELDQYAKHVLGAKMYLRYMDDFLVLVKTKAEATMMLQELGEYCRVHLRLLLNRKSGVFPARRGVDFVGWRSFCDYKLLRQRSKRAIRAIVRDYREDEDLEKLAVALASWRGHAMHGDCWRFERRVVMEFLGV